MRHYFIILILILIVPLGGYCQNKPSTITVIGKSENPKSYIGHKIKFEIEDESNKCDSNYPMSSEEKLGHLLSFAKAGYHNFDKLEKIEKFDQNKSKLFYECIIKDSLEFIAFLKNCDNLGIIIQRHNYYFGPKTYEDEYDYALSAFNNAFEKAQSYSKILDVKIKSIAYIDDFTTFQNSNFQTKPTYNEIQENLYYFGRYSSFFADIEEIGYSNIKNSPYTLKVVFEVE